jgi:hypothetical protein
LSLRHGEASICVVIPVGAKDRREEVRDRFVANCARPSSVHTGFILFFFSFFLLVAADLCREYYLRPRKEGRVTTAEDGRRLKEEEGKPFGTHFFVKFDFTAQERL